jgi:hypothetical protein
MYQSCVAIHPLNLDSLRKEELHSDKSLPDTRYLDRSIRLIRTVYIIHPDGSLKISMTRQKVPLDCLSWR